jgi:hypothetical protein
MAGSCEHGNEPSGFIKSGEFLDQLRYYQLCKKDSDPQSYIVYNKLLTHTQVSMVTGLLCEREGLVCA